MKKSLIIAMVMLLGPAGQAFAAVASCPSRAPDEALKPFRQRTHDYCEIKWGGLSTKPVGETHDTYINICARDCYKVLGRAAQNLGSQVAGNQIGLAAGLAGAAAGLGATLASDNGPPASP
jgi:hypothetical protein